jgi:ElaB/YqjD/DUF883 family membrane-anchored ribosome-binding protein
MSAIRTDTEKLVGDFKEVARDAGELLKDSANGAKMTVRRLEEKAVDGAKATDRVIREHPYQTIGIAFGVGMLVGWLVTRKS